MNVFLTQADDQLPTHVFHTISSEKFRNQLFNCMLKDKVTRGPNKSFAATTKQAKQHKTMFNSKITNKMPERKLKFYYFCRLIFTFF